MVTKFVVKGCPLNVMGSYKLVPFWLAVKVLLHSNDNISICATVSYSDSRSEESSKYRGDMLSACLM